MSKEGMQEVSMTGKRAAEEDLKGPEASGFRGEKEARRAAEEDQDLLAVPKLGSGPLWRLQAGKGASNEEEEGDEGLFRCRAQLEQALSCSALADVKFVFDDGESGVSGHRGMLGSVSIEFLGMFESGMVEAKSGEVRVRGVSRESFRGFLELLYLGRARTEIARADGREVWVLADLYDVKGMKEWLKRNGLKGDSVCAALQYGMEGSGFLEGLVEACKKLAACEGLSLIGEESLRGVSCAAARVLLEAFLQARQSTPRDFSARREGFEYVARWAKVNGGLVCGNSDVDSLVGLIGLGKMTSRDLMEIVRPTGLVSEADLDMYRRCFEEGIGNKELRTLKVFGSRGNGPGQFNSPTFCAVGWKDAQQRLAVCDCERNRVLVFDVGSGECVLTLGSWEEEDEDFDMQQENFHMPCGVAFNQQGEIIVADRGKKNICVFDWMGQFIRKFDAAEMEGLGYIEPIGPIGVAVNEHGDIIVFNDDEERRVHVLCSDWTSKLSFQTKREQQQPQQPQEPQEPRRVLQARYCHKEARKRARNDIDPEKIDVAVGPDGDIVVAGIYTVKVYNASGTFVRKIGSYGEGLEQFRRPYSVAVSSNKDILVVDKARRVQLFSKDGVFLRSIGKDDIGGVDDFEPTAVCVDDEEHVFICNMAAGNVVMLG